MARARDMFLTAELLGPAQVSQQANVRGRLTSVTGAVQQAMNSGGPVPETRLLGEGELSPDHAWRALRRYGSWRLLCDAFLRFRSGDGFSHARALGLQLCLAAVPLLIALNGLASKLGDPQRAGRVVADTVLALTPGASESLVSQLLTDQGRTRDLGQVALTLGLLTAVVALTTAAGQIERGANRIYGIDQDRPALQKYRRAFVPDGRGRSSGAGQLPATGGWRCHRCLHAALVSLERGNHDGLEPPALAGEPGVDRGDGVAAVPARTPPAAAGFVMVDGRSRPGHGAVVADQSASGGLCDPEQRLRRDLWSADRGHGPVAVGQPDRDRAVLGYRLHRPAGSQTGKGFGADLGEQQQLFEERTDTTRTICQ
jgi:hypothetical protein